MKKVIVFLMLIGLMLSCDNDDDQEIESQTNKVVLLKVDFLTNIFEGGKELEFSSSSSFTISSTYLSPGDFGSIQLFYDELNEKIFDGTIIWAGTGAISYPTEIDLPNTFPITSDELPLPDIDRFEKVIYDESAYYPDPIEYSNIWNSINNLEVVSNYFISNPNGKINLFLYTPSVGIGDPAEWDWFVILKN